MQRFAAKVGKHLVAPGLARPAEPCGCLVPSALLGRGPSQPGKPPALGQVELARSQVQSIARAHPLQSPTTGAGAEPLVEEVTPQGHVGVDEIHRAGRRLVPPDPVDEALHRDDLVGPQGEERQQGSPLRSRRGDRLAGHDDVEGTQQPYV
jgi:hypothetical protein